MPDATSPAAAIRIRIVWGLLLSIAIASSGRAVPADARGENAVAWPTMVVFTRAGCPHCAAAKGFLDELRAEQPGLVVTERRVDLDPAALATLHELSRKAGVAAGVPTFVVGDELLVGFDTPETTGERLRALLTERSPASSEGVIDVPVLGRLSADELGLPLFTVVLGLLDGFNPCAMWVLLFLLSMLVNVHERRRMALIAGTFVLVSGAVYFAFMSAWLNVFLLIGLSPVIQRLLGGVALVVGLVNVKDFFAFKRGVSLTIPERMKPGIYSRVRRVLRAETMLAALSGAAVLAVLVNFVELLCTAGFPAVYTAILSRKELSPVAHYAYLGLYNVAYILDDSVMVAIAVVTLTRRKLTERAGRWLKLVSGIVMLWLAAGLILWPELLL